MPRPRKVFFALMSAAAIGCLLLIALRPVRRAPSGLHIDSRPSGASVFLNGRLLGQTPMTFDEAMPGAYSMRLEKDGCEPVVRRVDLTDGFVVVNETLILSPGSALSVEVKPDNAQVLLDGHLVGHTPVKLHGLAAGWHTVIVRKPNFEPLCENIELEPAETTLLPGELKDRVEAMLLAQINGDRQRVAHYADYAHYLFIRNRLKEAADEFVKAMVVSEQKLTFAGGTPVKEMELAERHRLEDANELRYQIERHIAWPGKDVGEFKQTLVKANALLKGKSKVLNANEKMQRQQKLLEQSIQENLKFKDDLERLKRDLQRPFRQDD